MAKPKLELKKKSDAQFSDFASNHITKMDGNPSYPSPVPPAPELDAALAAYNTKLAAVLLAEQAYRQAVVEKELARTELERLLTTRSAYVEAASGGSEVKILSSGFEVRSNGTPIGLLPAPANLAATAGDYEGDVDTSWQPLTGAVSYEVECRLHQDSGTWQRVKTVTNSRLIVTGLIGGAVYAFRVRGVNAAGNGAWSDEAVRRAP